MAVEIPIIVPPPDLGPTINGFKALKNSLRDAIGELAGLTEGTQEYIEQAQRVGEIRDQVNALNDSIRNTSNSPVENLSNSFGLLGQQVSNLDFQGAAVSLRQFGTSLGGIKFSDVAGQAKAFGKTMLEVGKGILTNPLFLIPAILIGIGAAIFALKDKVKIIGAAFEVFGNIIGSVVQTLKDLSDAIGLSSFAIEDSATRTIASAKAEQAAVEERYDAEIRKANAAGKATFQLEEDKARAVIASAQKQRAALESVRATQEVNTDAFKESTKQINDLNKTIDKSITDIEVLRISAQKKADDDAKKAQDKTDAANKAAYDRRIADEAKLQAGIKKAKDDAFLQTIKDDEVRANSAANIAFEQRAKDIEATKASSKIKNEALIANELQLQTDLNAIKATYDAKRLADFDKRVEAEQAEQLRLANIALDEEEKAKADAQKKLDLEKETNEKKIALAKETAEEQKRLNEEQQQAYYNSAEKAIGAVQNLSDAYYNNQLAAVKGNADAENKIKKKQFETNKAFAIAQAIIDGVRGVQAALTVPPPAGYVLAAATGIIAAANVAKIASTQYQASGSPSSAAPTSVKSPSSTSSGAFNSSAPVTPTPVQSDLDKARSQRVYVLESDIRNTTNKVNLYESRSTFGD